MKITRLFRDLFSSEQASGYVLIFTTIISLLLANVFIGQPFIDFFHHTAGFSNAYLSLNLPVEYWINDGLMTIFFLLAGLETEREIYIGELSSIRNASLPVFAAIGGMLVPFLIHFAFNNGLATASGGGIPMATYIAFAIGVLSLGIIPGLVAGKPIGIMLFCGAAVALGWSSLPDGISWKHLLAAGQLGGIGFTMSIFITLLAFDNTTIAAQSKMAILAASVLGLSALAWAGKQKAAG